MGQRPTLTELTSDAVESDGEAMVVDLGDEAAEDLLGALSPGTARRLLEALAESPAYPAALADEVETSVQNVHYHLEKLEAADIVEVIDTVYSEKGREMKVYAPVAEPLVIVAGDEEDRRAVADALSKILGAVGVLGLLSVAVQWVVEQWFYPGGPTPVGGAGQYAASPVTNVAPPVGLYVFFLGLAFLAGWMVWKR